MANPRGVKQATAFGVFMRECSINYKENSSQGDEFISEAEEMINFHKQCSVWWYKLSEEERHRFELFAEKENIQNKMIIKAYDLNNPGLPTFDNQFRDTDHILNFSDKPEKGIKMTINPNNKTKLSQGNAIKPREKTESEISDRVEPYFKFVQSNWRKVALSLASNTTKAKTSSVGPLDVKEILHTMWNDKMIKTSAGKRDGRKKLIQTTIKAKDDKLMRPQGRSRTFSPPSVISRKPSQQGECKFDEKNTRDEDIYDLNEMLKLPSDECIAKEELLNKLDREIAMKQRLHDLEMEQLDEDMKAQKQKKVERKLRELENAKCRNQLESELTEPRLRQMFHDNLQYLKDIRAGKVKSSRHDLYYKSIATRHALHFAVITDPFTDQQFNWTMDEFTKVWMATEKEAMDNKEYIWKVLVSEIFIKFYSDFFNISRDEAMVKIRETPLHKKDRLKEFKASSEEDESDDN